jgi:hypothetical protein
VGRGRDRRALLPAACCMLPAACCLPPAACFLRPIEIQTMINMAGQGLSEWGRGEGHCTAIKEIPKLFTCSASRTNLLRKWGAQAAPRSPR